MYNSREIALSALSEVLANCENVYSDDEKEKLYQCISLLGRDIALGTSYTPVSERVSYALNVYEFFNGGYAKGAKVTGWDGSEEEVSFDTLYSKAVRFDASESNELKVVNENIIFLYHVDEDGGVSYEKRKGIQVPEGYILYSSCPFGFVDPIILTHDMIGTAVVMADGSIVLPLLCKDCSYANSFVRTVLREYYESKKRAAKKELDSIDKSIAALK